MPKPDDDFEIEMREHLDLLTERFVRQGMDPAQAALAARRQFGNSTLMKETRRTMQTLPQLESAWRAVRYATRQLRASPVFTVTAVLSLALGIGANTAIFTLLDQLVLRLLPVPEPERIVMIWSTGPHQGDNRGVRVSSYPLCQDYQRQAAAFESVFCRFSTTLAATVGGNTEPVRAELVSSNYFQGLRVGPSAGRVLLPETDDRPDGAPVVVVSERYWVDRLGANPNVAGSKILVNKHPMEIVGVAAAGFTGVDSAQAPQMWLPVRLKPLLTEENGLKDRHYHFLQLFGRMKPGQTAESARASLQPLFHQALEQEVQAPEFAKKSPYDREQFLKRTVLLEPAATGYSDMRQRYAPALFVLMGMAGLILLIACSNVASLLVARALARRKEMAVRLSIGAGRGTLIGHLMVESLLLACAGAFLGLTLSVLATRAMLSMLPSGGALLLLRAEPDLRVLLFSIGVTIGTALLFGLAPAAQATRLDLFTTLKATAGGATGGGHTAAIRKALVTVQVALSLLLLVLAGFFSRSLVNLKQTGTGLREVEKLATFHVDPAKGGYSSPQLRRLYGDILAELRVTPGVTAATLTWVPLFQGWAPSWNMRVEGHRTADGENMEVENNIVAPGYWAAMGIPLLAGRELDERDRFDFAGGPRFPNRAVVNRSFAKRFFPNESPLGKHFGIGEKKEELGVEIVGMVEDALYAGPRQGARPMVYFSYLQADYPLDASFYIRTSGEASASFPALRRIVAKFDASLPIYEMKTVEQQRDDILSTERLITSLSIVFGALATVMAALGIYGVLAFVVAQRSKEIGLRMALGAQSLSVLRLVLGEVLTLFGAGLAIGLPAAYLASRYVSSQLFGVTPGDAWMFVAAAGTLGIVAVISGLVPARRAVIIDPLIALRYD
jgi:predicted permease